jgi:hypothetical protein
MNTKLTLSMDKTVIKKTKAYARFRRVSISRLVETYLRSLSTEVDQGRIELAPITRTMTGMVARGKRSTRAYKDILAEALLEDHR